MNMEVLILQVCLRLLSSFLLFFGQFVSSLLLHLAKRLDSIADRSEVRLHLLGEGLQRHGIKICWVDSVKWQHYNNY